MWTRKCVTGCKCALLPAPLCDTKHNSNSVEEYYEKLCKKFPQISFNTNGGVVPCNSNKVVVNLSYDCLKKMANDPEFAKEIEWNLSGEVAANSQVYSFAGQLHMMLMEIGNLHVVV